MQFTTQSNVDISKITLDIPKGQAVSIYFDMEQSILDMLMGGECIAKNADGTGCNHQRAVRGGEPMFVCEEHSQSLSAIKVMCTRAVFVTRSITLDISMHMRRVIVNMFDNPNAVVFGHRHEKSYPLNGGVYNLQEGVLEVIRTRSVQLAERTRDLIVDSIAYSSTSMKGKFAVHDIGAFQAVRISSEKPFE